MQPISEGVNWRAMPNNVQQVLSDMLLSFEFGRKRRITPEQYSSNSDLWNAKVGDIESRAQKTAYGIPLNWKSSNPNNLQMVCSLILLFFISEFVVATLQ